MVFVSFLGIPLKLKVFFDAVAAMLYRHCHVESIPMPGFAVSPCQGAQSASRQELLTPKTLIWLQTATGWHAASQLWFPLPGGSSASASIPASGPCLYRER